MRDIGLKFFGNGAREMHACPGGAGGGAWHPQILADQLTLSQPRGADYAYHISTGTPGF